MNKYTKIAGAAGIGLAVGALLYGGLYLSLRHVYSDKFDMDGFKVYFDGIVMDHVAVGKNITLDKVYLSGKPWTLFSEKPRYVFIEKANINTAGMLNALINWPFSRQAPMTIDKVFFDLDLFGQKIDFEGSAKQTPGTPLMVDFESRSKALKIAGQSEIRVKKNQITMIDFEFQNARASLDLLKTKRSSGWLSLSYENDWQVIGEINAGFLQMLEYVFFDGTLKINGPAAQPDFSFASNLQKTMLPIVMDKQKDNAYIRDQEKAFPVAWAGMNESSISNIKSVLDKIDQLQEQEKQLALKQEEEKAKKLAKKLPKKEKVIVLAKEEKAVEPEVREVVEPLKIEPVKLPETTLQKLTAQSAFAGFFYDQNLVYIVKECENSEEKTCWTARAQGGKFNYNPEFLPQYILKLKSYEQVQVLRRALLNFNVDMITLSGKADKAVELTLKGKTSYGQPADIQLSVLDLE